MELEVNHKKISDSPFKKGVESNFIFEDENNITQIITEISQGNPTCFLVSGYRGVGKTSFIKKIESYLDKKNSTKFIYLNLSKYSEYSIILRNIIRSIYLALKDDLNQIDHKTKDDLALLFKRTFYDINKIESEKISKENLNQIKLKISLKDLILFFLILTTGLNLKYKFINFNTSQMDLIIFSLSIIATIITNFDLTKTINSKKESSSELNVKEFFDDEIAEYHLKNILKTLKEKGFKLVFIFDELDKIENDQSVDKFISELKPLMLSGNASFLLVTGQTLCYKYNLAHTIDDSLISSIFSKIIHVPLLSPITFRLIFENLLTNKTDIKKEGVEHYINSLILQSNRIPRRFLNLIRQNLIWKGKKSFIQIDDEDIDAYKTDTIMLNILNKIEDNQISSEYDDAIKDFFVVQLYIWIQRLKLKKGTSFISEEIYNIERDNSSSHLAEYLSQVKDLLNLLLDKMVENELLLREEKKVDKIKKNYYKWLEGVKIKSENITEDSQTVKSKFLEQFIDLERYVRDIYIDVTDDYTYDSRKLSIKSMLSQLAKRGIIREKWMANKRLLKLIELRNKIVHGHEINVDDLDLSQEFRFILGRFKAEIIEDYTFYVSKNYLKRYDYNLILEKLSSFDFVAVPNDPSGTHILFEIKYGLSSPHTIESIKRKILEFYKTEDIPKKHLVIFYYAKNMRGKYDQLKEKIDIFINQQFPKLKNNISIYYTSEYRSDASTGRLETFLEQIIDKIEKNRERQRPLFFN